jgi:hypothetical protein
VAGGQFRYQKMFGDEGYFATGVVVIPVGSEKPAKPSKDNCYVSGSCIKPGVEGEKREEWQRNQSTVLASRADVSGRGPESV